MYFCDLETVFSIDLSEQVVKINRLPISNVFLIFDEYHILELKGCSIISNTPHGPTIAGSAEEIPNLGSRHRGKNYHCRYSDNTATWHRISTKGGGIRCPYASHDEMSGKCSTHPWNGFKNIIVQSDKPPNNNSHQC